MARGLVKSSTRCPASSPSPSTEMTTKSSEEMVAVVWEKLGEDPRSEGIDSKISWASVWAQTIEHSSGVTETFRNAWRFAQDVCDCEYAPWPCSTSVSSGKSSLSMGCRYWWYSARGTWIRLNRVSYTVPTLSADCAAPSLTQDKSVRRWRFLQVHMTSGSDHYPTKTYNKMDMGGHECQWLLHDDLLDQLLIMLYWNAREIKACPISSIQNKWRQLHSWRVWFNYEPGHSWGDCFNYEPGRLSRKRTVED